MATIFILILLILSPILTSSYLTPLLESTRRNLAEVDGGPSRRIPFLAKYETLVKIGDADEEDQREQQDYGREPIMAVRGIHHCFSLEADGHKFRVFCHRGATTAFQANAKLKFRTKSGRVEEGELKDYVRTSVEGIVGSSTEAEDKSYVQGRISSAGIFEGYIDADEDTYYVERMDRFTEGIGNELGSSDVTSIVYKASDVILCPSNKDQDLERGSNILSPSLRGRPKEKNWRDWDEERSDTVLPEEEEERRGKPVPTVIYDVRSTCSVDRTDSSRVTHTPSFGSLETADTLASKGNLGKICRLKVWADFSFFAGHASRDRHEAVSTVQTIVNAVDRALRKIDFNGDGRSDGYGVRIGELEVIETEAASPFLQDVEENPDQFLESVQDDDLDSFCLGLVVTARHLKGGTLGRAFQASPEKSEVGGICAKSFRMMDGTVSHRNTLFLTLDRSGHTVPMGAATLVAAHLMGHSWGAGHDNGRVSNLCRTAIDEDYGGGQQAAPSSYIMDDDQLGARKSRKLEFSSCSIRDMAEVIKTKGTCLR